MLMSTLEEHPAGKKTPNAGPSLRSEGYPGFLFAFDQHMVSAGGYYLLARSWNVMSMYPALVDPCELGGRPEIPPEYVKLLYLCI